MKSRRVSCPEPDEGFEFRAYCADTGEVLRLDDLAPILRTVALGFEHRLATVMTKSEKDRIEQDTIVLDWRIELVRK